MDRWYSITNENDVSTPALLVYPQRVESNILKMISITGDPARLRPHVKTHKMPELVKLQMKSGISKFKCATIAEAEMTLDCGVKDLLLAYQPVGPNIGRFFRLRKKFPDAEFSCIADCREVIMLLSENALKLNLEARVWIDINVGMDRTGVYPDETAAGLYRLLLESPMLRAEGLHVYDGHIHESDPAVRRRICDEAYEPVQRLIPVLQKMSGRQVRIIAGGTPTFPFHALRDGVETSPGTSLLWDYGDSTSFTDLDFRHAAVLMTRIVSKPAKDLICLDLGHKAVASEFPQPRIRLPELGKYEIRGHNEEHMVIRTTEASGLKVGDVLYAIPYHICPTVDRYDTVTVVTGGAATDEWQVTARKRRITV
ncbi:MAG: D-TA family PLP-dependent enzyme [Bacteroidales bacterium]